ncbi:unnamed protein product [Mytilus coruscus]|uniref:MEGF10_11 n=1 Tax=Mytilus coruscus TaxID=42192 RepID=A0A6J7ZUE5_MYTCO|nr:unnamed protein product [Mytilus coruscus]
MFCFEYNRKLYLSLLTACGVGYHTIEAGRKKCKPCPPHKYGKKCGRTCICKANESCDNKNGRCIPWTTFRTFTEYLNYTRYQTQSTEESDRRITVDVNLTKNKATKNYAILIYMNCAGFIVLVLCAVAAFYKYQKNVKNVPQGTIKYGERGSDIPPIPPRSMQPNVFIELQDNESVYELIDDENLLNF